MITSPLGRLARFCFRHPRHVLAVSGILLLLSVASLTTMSTEQNLMRLLPQELPSIRAFNQIRENFDLESSLFVLLEGGPPAALLEASDAYVERLRARKDLVASAHNRLTEDERRFYFEVLPRYLFLTLPDDDLREALAFLQDPEALRTHMENNLRLLTSAAPGIKSRIERDPLDLAGRTHALRRLARAGGKVSFSEEGYALSEEGNAVLIRVRGHKPAQEISYARRLVGAVLEAAPEGFTAGLAGGYAVAVQDEGMIRSDMMQSSMMSVALIFLLFWAIFRSFGTMVRLGMPLITALLWTLGAIVLIFDSINPLIAGSIAVIAGLGIDFSIHVMIRFRHELITGAAREDAVVTAVTRVGRGITIAAATTVAVFFSFLASDLTGMSEFGIITGIGIVLCLVSTVTVLPAILALGKSRSMAVLPGVRPLRRGPVVSLAVSGAVLVAAAWIGFFRGPTAFSFEPDWKNLRPAHDPALETQERISRLFRGTSESIALLVRGEPLEKFERLQPALERLRTEGVLGAYQTVLSILPPVEQQKKNRRILERVDADRIVTDVRNALDAAGFRVEPYEEYLSGLGALIRRKDILDRSVLKAEKLESLLGTYVAGDIGMAQLFPIEALWEREARRRVVDRIRDALDETGVEYSLTGFKIVSGQLETLLKGDFRRLLIVAGSLILLITLVTFRDPRIVLLSVFPLTAGIILLAAFMKLGGYHVNVMNLIAFPMVLGLGIDDGVHLTHLYRDSRPEEFEGLVPVTLRAVLLTTVTTMIGFGSLALTENRGVASMGLVAGVGMLCCLIPSFFTLPAALFLMNRRRLRASPARATPNIDTGP